MGVNTRFITPAIIKRNANLAKMHGVPQCVGRGTYLLDNGILPGAGLTSDAYLMSLSRGHNSLVVNGPIIC